MTTAKQHAARARASAETAKRAAQRTRQHPTIDTQAEIDENDRQAGIASEAAHDASEAASLADQKAAETGRASDEQSRDEAYESAAMAHLWAATAMDKTNSPDAADDHRSEAQDAADLAAGIAA